MSSALKAPSKTEIGSTSFTPPYSNHSSTFASSSNDTGLLEGEGRGWTIRPPKRKQSFVPASMVSNSRSSVASAPSYKGFAGSPPVLYQGQQDLLRRSRTGHVRMSAALVAGPPARIDEEVVERAFDIAFRQRILGPQSEEDEGKKTLVLSLSEMLVHEHQDFAKPFDFALA